MNTHSSLCQIWAVKHTEPRKGHRNRNKKNLKGNQNNNITFKPLLIFPFQYIAEKKLKQEYWRGNQKKISRFIDLIYPLFNIMLGSNWLIFFTNGRPGIYWYIEILCWYVEIFKLNKRFNKFSFYSAKYWEGKIRSRLNDIFIVSISFLFFLDLISILFFFLGLISILFYIVLTTYYIV